MPYTYVTDIIGQITDQLQVEYREHRIAHVNAWKLLEKVTGKQHTELLACETIELSQDAYHTLQKWIDAITKQHKPIQYIIGSVPFLDAEIFVREPVVIPRPETEHWCHTLITQLKENGLQQFRILDMCTGTGCVAISIAQAFDQAEVYAADISHEALELTAKNAEHNNVTVHCIQSHLFADIPQEQAFDLIVSNPPYISQNTWSHLRERITQWEDPRALVAPDDGTGIIQDIIQQSPAYLTPWSYNVPQLWIEIGHDQGARVRTMFEQSGWIDVHIHKDIAGHDRVVTGKY